MILGIDTSAGQCAVALIAGDSIVARAVEPMARGHAERLFPLIETALAEAGFGLESLNRIAVCTGPGSFTGLRVGVAAARGLALGRGVPAVGVTRFEAVAAAIARPAWIACMRSAGSSEPLLPPEGPAATRPRAVEDKVGWAESRPMAVALAGRGGSFLQRFAPDLAPLGEPAFLATDALAALAAGEDAATDVRLGDGWAAAGLTPDLAPQGLADPAITAAIAARAAPGPMPAPLYLRDADADPPREPPPPLLD
ncbi:MAG: tRNA (adenosine(37)-N6)-threonylcarbamoyltransferase complex dimerization subunit type 1 TsaB [Pseudomonadota bacterium]